MTNRIVESELIINSDNSIFHLHIKPEMLTDKIILVGDPGRVNLVASYFDDIAFEISNREFHTIAGTYQGKPIMCISHGIGPDNIDIVVNELDALANIDFSTRTVKPEIRQLSMVRIGTSGSMQADIPIGAMVVARKSVGIDGALFFYEGTENIRDIELETEFVRQTHWHSTWNRPYIVEADAELADRISTPEMFQGMTIAANGFYGPQGRHLRIGLSEPDYIESIHQFSYNGLRITNFEMESAMLQGLAKLMGHKAVTVCSMIAGRISDTANTNYRNTIEDLIKIVLDRI